MMTYWPCPRSKLMASVVKWGLLSTLLVLPLAPLLVLPLPLAPLSFLTDPFADADEFTSKDNLEKSTKAPEYVHIRIQQRNGRKTLTTVQGVPNEYDPKKLLKYFKKEFACNGTLVEDEDLGQVIQLQGDQRTNVSQMLIDAVGLRECDLLRSDREWWGRGALVDMSR